MSFMDIQYHAYHLGDFGKRKSDGEEVSVEPDRGCELSLSCLRCPLPVCKYDQPGQERQELLVPV